jgi:polyisoprenoid-binding protein YceI
VIDEVLNGAPVTVVGTTNQVSGAIALDLNNSSAAQVGTIQINARTLTTDSEQRNNAIKNMILKTNDNEYITFAPTALVGLPERVAVGQSYSFQIVGQLTIAGQTNEATFDVTVTPTAEGALEGSATTTINYADWGISVPDVPFVTGLADTATLEFDFVATAE